MFTKLTVFKGIIIHLLLAPNFATIGQFIWTVEGEINLCPTAWHSLRRLLLLITNRQPFGISFTELYPYRQKNVENIGQISNSTLKKVRRSLHSLSQNSKRSLTSYSNPDAGEVTLWPMDVPVCWNLDFTWTPVCIRIHFNTFILSSSVRKIPLRTRTSGT
jgi:hypothetical protein